MKSTISTISIIFLAIIGFSSGYIYGQSPVAPINVFGTTTANINLPDEFSPLFEVYSLVQDRYFEQPVDKLALAEGAIDGMLATLDDQHTRYLSPLDEEAARDSMSGEFQGIGAEVESVDGDITIVAPIDGSPAEGVGLLPGDILRAADGVELTGMDVSDAAGLVRGPAGTAVLLLIERNGETFEVEIIRDVIKLPSVRGEIIEENIAYVRLSRFAGDSQNEMADLLETLLAENPSGMILDLRRNPGGSLETVVDIADQLLPEGNILIERFGDGSEEIFAATNDGIAEDVPLVLLIDEGSASASELLAGAIKDRERGVLIGQTTFGKGTVQTWQGLSNGGGVRITIAQWLTPGGTWIHENGLDPDYFIPLPDFELDDEFEDTQLQAAIDYLRGEEIISIPPIVVESEG
ncbi:MAG: S41 family peptidase [Chloroflexi bacterium]|nr:MAG: S41 family peptidase [Chloroflexota bacterium]